MPGLNIGSLPVMPVDLTSQSAASRMPSGQSHSIEEVATNFESIFLSQMLKEMRQTLEPGGLFAQDSGDVFGGLFDMFMGQHMAQAGGIGVANFLKRHLENTGTDEHHARATTTKS